MGPCGLWRVGNGASWQGQATEDGPAQLSMSTTCMSPHVFEYGHLLQACNVDACGHELPISPTTQTTPGVDDACEGWPWDLARGTCCGEVCSTISTGLLRSLAFAGRMYCAVRCPAGASRCITHLTQPDEIFCCLTGSCMSLGDWKQCGCSTSGRPDG
jgi:hypothetical protein